MNAQQLLRKSPIIAGRPDLPNPRSAGARSTTASSRRGCATAAASPPTRSTASTISWRRTPPRGGPPSSSARASRARPCRRSPCPRRRRSPAIRSAISASSTTGKNICCSSTPAARSGRWRTASPKNSPTSASASAGGARVRRRRRRRLGAGARDARHARPLSAHAVLHGRQGNQPRGRAADIAENVGSFLRTSGDGAGAHQPRLCGCAVAAREIAQRRLKPGVARAAARPAIRRTSSRSRSSASSRSWPTTGARA